MLSSPVLSPVGQDGRMSSPGPRAGGPTPRRSFTPAQKLEYLASYEAACQNNEGGAFLRREGLYSSQMTEWRRLRDAGVLAGKKAGETIGKLSKDQAEIARLRRQLAVTEGRLKTSEAALGVLGKLHALLEDLSERNEDEPKPGKR
jgi:transposase